MASSEIYVPMYDDVRLYVRTVGDGPRLLFIPNGMYMFDGKTVTAISPWSAPARGELR